MQETKEDAVEGGPERKEDKVREKRRNEGRNYKAGVGGESERLGDGHRVEIRKDREREVEE